MEEERTQSETEDRTKLFLFKNKKKRLQQTALTCCVKDSVCDVYASVFQTEREQGYK